MKAKARKRKVRREVKAILCVVLVLASLLIAKANEPEIVGYTYDTGSTVWEMASRHCPYGMDMQEFVREIEKANGIENSTVYKNWTYKIPVYETESEYLDMNTVVGYETSDDGVLLLTNDGNGYFIEK